MAKMIGKVVQFGSKGYGFIEGENGEKYFFHKKSLTGRGKIRVKSKVEFKVEETDKGLAALSIRTISKKPSKPLSNGTIKFLFTILFIAQIISFYFILQ
ncbi:Cold shock protein [hydrothermal vent metagenome]|uniref:Cold shock protein n=1 Tax=hydrothermal vent metagenome TaxID=652676 RepID=A0A1W1BNW3_9ZZZZ